jgi:hypothetical protein
VRPVDAQQWRFLGEGGLLRPGEPARLVNDVVGAGVSLDDRSLPCWGVPVPIIVTRAGTSPDPIRSGERIGLCLAGHGPLSPPEVRGGGSAEPWEVTGCFTGAGVAFDRPVGLLHLGRGDHLVARVPDTGASGGHREPRKRPPEPSGQEPSPPWAWWAGEVGFPATAFPRELRAVEGVPSDVCLRGTAVPMDSGEEPGGRKGLEMSVGPGTAELLAGLGEPVLCRWEGPWGAWLADLVGSTGPVEVRVQGPLLRAPELSVDPVRSLAWAVDSAGRSLRGGEADPSWPATRVMWRVARLPVPGRPVSLRRAGTWLLPLPVRDGEPGTSTTVTFTSPITGPRTSGSGTSDRGTQGGGRPMLEQRRRPVGGAAGPSPRCEREVLETPPAIVRDPRTGRRLLRLVLVDHSATGEGPATGAPWADGVVVLGYTVLVHGGGRSL